ncbi:MAG TPA: 7-cyano-7-deazaguanine synthase [Solirubrobacterales bacterium]
MINDCAAPEVPGILHVRSQDTAYGEKNFLLRYDELAEGLPRQLVDRELDLLEVAGHLFATDIACERGAGDVEWNRAIKVWLPVRDPDYWTTQRAVIEGVWTDLTGDDIEIRFEQATDPLEAPRMAKAPFPNHDGIALLSGGQDSFAGALDLLASGHHPLYLSHVASGATSSAQKSVEAHLRQRPDTQVKRLKLSARKAPGKYFPGQESSQRSRTFLFLVAASVVASVGDSAKVWLNENGVMALHLPLTPARIGSLSTHTAAPPILSRIEALVSDVLGKPTALENRLVGLTKPEVIELAVSLGAKDEMQDTVSCWQIGRTREHCGICAPCILRRVSCEAHGVPDVQYAADVFDDSSALDDPKARDNLGHMISLIQDLNELSDVNLEYEYPELLGGQPILSLTESIALHRRWADQAATVLFGHSVPKSL